MISPYHQQIAEHYEKFPYPSYPLFGFGSWKQLDAINLDRWHLERKARDLWIAGCGTIGPFMFGRRNPGVAIFATDVSRRSLRQLQLRLWIHGIRNVRTLQEDLMVSNYVESFDAIDCFGVIHHTVSPAKALERLSSALRVGGVLRLMVYSRDARFEIERLRAEVSEKKVVSITDLKRLVRERGLQAKGDLASSSGLADALLNPIVQTFDRKALDELLATAKQLEVLNIDQRSNYVCWLRKR